MGTDSAQPLRGRTILVTRPAHQASVLTQLIEQAGGRIVLFPAIAIEPPIDPKGAALLLETLEGGLRCDFGGPDGRFEIFGTAEEHCTYLPYTSGWPYWTHVSATWIEYAGGR